MEVKKVRRSESGDSIIVKFVKGQEYGLFSYRLFELDEDDETVYNLEYSASVNDDLYDEIYNWVNKNIISKKIVIYKNKVIE